MGFFLFVYPPGTLRPGSLTIIVDQFRFIQEADKGFDAHDTIVIKLPAEEPRIVETFMEELRTTPGIVKADGSSYYPGIIETKYVFEIETEKGMEQLLVPMIRCGYDYMNVLNIQVANGRAFMRNQVSDQYGAYMVNETAARKFGWKQAVGRKIRGPLDGNNEAYREGEVIGVTKDFNFSSLHSTIEPVLIFLTDKNWGSQFIYAKLDPLRPDDLISTVEGKFKDQWPDEPFNWEYLDSKYLSLYKKDYEVKSIFGLASSFPSSFPAWVSSAFPPSLMRCAQRKWESEKLWAHPGCICFIFI